MSSIPDIHKNSLISWFASNPVAANLLMILIIGAGLVSVFSIEKRTLPDFETNTVTIVVPFPGAGPREVEQGVVLKIEEAIADSLGVEKVISVSRDGSARIDVVVASGYDVDQLMDEIKRKIDAVSALPRDSERPVISKTEPRMQVQWLSIYGASDVRRLKPLVLGVIVDDAIIIGESVDNEITQRGASLESVIRGTKEVALPSTLGVLTSIAAFAPLAYVEGQLRPFFATVSVVVVLCLIFSLVESKLILPAHLAHGLKQKPEGARQNWLRKLQKALQEKLQLFIEKRYRPALNYALDQPVLVLAMAVAVFMVVIGIMGSGVVRYEFYPNVPSDFLRATVTTNQSASVGLRDRTLAQMEDAVISLNEKYLGTSGGVDLVSSLQAQFVIPMAISLAFGVIFATAITLLLVPVLIVLFERRQEVPKAVLFKNGLQR